MKSLVECVALTLFISQYSFANVYYVGTAGSDGFGDGSQGNPWKTLRYAVAKVNANQGHTIYVGAGIFIENGLVEVPLGVSIEGAGADITIFKAASSFYYHPDNDPGYGTDKFLISLSGVNSLDGNQTLRNFTIDGDSKQLHGGIYVRYRNKVIIDRVKVQNTHYTGIWLWDVKDSQLSNAQLINCSWGSTGYSSGALNLGNLERVEISRVNVNENMGYGIKALGPDGYNDIFYVAIHDCHVSVDPFGLWNDGTSPNLSIELWQSTLVGCEIYNSYVDNAISLVNSAVASTGIQTIRVHHDTIDIDTRAHGAGYGIELSIHDAEIDHNYFFRGSYGIANWDNPMRNWSIHHNTFYALQEVTIGEVVRSQWSGLHNVKFYNNTIEFTGNQTMNVFGLYGGTSENMDIKNNLIINSNTGYSHYPNQLIHTQNGATITGGTLQILKNSSSNLDPGDLIDSLLGLPILNPLIRLTNLPNPAVKKSGSRPTPYYLPAAGSSLIDAGQFVGFPFAGSAPDIGAFESVPLALPNLSPRASIVTPADNANYPKGYSIIIAANASDPDGTVTQVEFFNRANKLGESAVSPYEFRWDNPAPGRDSITVVATDNQHATTRSAAVPVTVTSGEVLDSTATGIVFGLFAPDAALTGGMTLFPDSTATKGSYFAEPEGDGKNDSVPPPGQATFNFQLPLGDNFIVWVRIKSPSAGPRGYFIKSESQNWTLWQVNARAIWSWVRITDPASGLPILVPFGEGFNTFIMGWHDDDVRVDRIILTNDPNYDPSRAMPETPSVLYPNPATDEFIIEFFSDLFEQVELRIWNLAGKLVRHSNVAMDIGQNKIPINISDLGNGCYVVSLSANGTQKYTFRLIIVH